MILTHSETGPKEANFPPVHLIRHFNADFDGDVLSPLRRYRIKGKRRGLGRNGNRIQIAFWGTRQFRSNVTTDLVKQALRKL